MLIFLADHHVEDWNAKIKQISTFGDLKQVLLRHELSKGLIWAL